VAQTYTGNKSPGVTVQIPLSTLASFWGDPDGDPVALVSMDLLSTNHVTITTDTNFVYYNSTNTAEDEWSYVVRDVRSYRPNDTVRTAVGKIHLNPPPPAPFVISIVPLSDGNKRLIFNGYNKFVWHAQAASNLVPPIAWQTISSNFFPGVIQFDDLTATNFATRFYRFEGGGP
jgi:hypothetical protein